jgi:uncharacterized protein YcbX
MGMQVEGLYVHPVTGCRGIPFEQVAVMPGGVEDTRRYVVYDADTRERVGAKQAPKLLSLGIAIGMTGLVEVTEPDQDIPHTLPVTETGKEVEVDEFGDLTPCHDQGDRWAEVFSRITDQDVRLARKVVGWTTGEVGIPPAERRNAPLHIVTTPTIDHIRELTGTEAGPRRYRPDVIIGGTGEPNAELEWMDGTLYVGDVPININRFAGRCAVTGFHPASGERINDVPKVFRQLEHREIDGRQKAVVGVYGYPLVEGSQPIKMGAPVRFEPRQ